MFYNTEGLPLPIIYDLFAKNNWVINWPNFIDEAIKNGWNPKTIISSIRECYIEKKDKDIVEEKTKLYLLLYYLK